jgi:hypothetical protein
VANDVVIEAPVHLETGTVEGLVYGDRDGDGTPDAGEEMRGIRVTFIGALTWDEYVARTGSDGRYRVELPVGRYSISAEDEKQVIAGRGPDELHGSEGKPCY